MRILLYSPAFLPQVGGLEIGQALLAEQFSRLGHEVTVVTTTAGDDGALPYRVLRRPGAGALLRAVRWCDVFFQANVSLRGLWPLLLVRRPWAVSHHSWYCRKDGRIAWQDRLKRYLLRFATVSISVSQAMAADLKTPSRVIPNAYRDHLFAPLPGVQRIRELVFLGRLVSDKGVDLLLAALAVLAARGLHPRLTVVGEGPEQGALRAQAARLGLEGQVGLTGTLAGPPLVRLLHEHRILVAPSRYNEPFGVVALEAIACGCVVVGSSGGGLPEAIGPCGVTFRNGCVEELADRLGELLRPDADLQRFRAAADQHLAHHRAEDVARIYLAALEESIEARRPGLGARARRLDAGGKNAGAR